MTDPTTRPTPTPSLQRLAPWAVFVALLVIGLVFYLRFADRVPSLMQSVAG